MEKEADIIDIKKLEEFAAFIDGRLKYTGDEYKISSGNSFFALMAAFVLMTFTLGSVILAAFVEISVLRYFLLTLSGVFIGLFITASYHLIKNELAAIRATTQKEICENLQKYFNAAFRYFKMQHESYETALAIRISLFEKAGALVAELNAGVVVYSYVDNPECVTDRLLYNRLVYVIDKFYECGIKDNIRETAKKIS